MAKKIYVKSNYFYIVDTETDYIFEGLAKEVRVRRLLETSDEFYFDNVNGFTEKVAFADIQDESGVAYVDLATFVTFYQDNTGNFNTPQAGGGVTQNELDSALSLKVDKNPNSDSFFKLDFGDYAYSKIGQSSISLNQAITIDNIFSEGITKRSNSFRLKKGRKYILTAKTRVNFANNTSFCRFCFYDETLGDYIDKDYTGNGMGNTSLNIPPSFTTNNTPTEIVNAVITPLENTYVSLKLIEVSGTISEVDLSRNYSNITIQEICNEKIPILVDIDGTFSAHSQGSTYTDDFPNNAFISLEDRILKVNLLTGDVDGSLVFASHIGGLTYHNGKIYTVFTPLANFNNLNPLSKIYEINPSTMTLIREVNVTGSYGIGGIGSDGSKIYIGYGSTLLTNGKIQEINTTTLALTGSIIDISNVSNEFGNGIQSLNYFDGKWYIGTHLKGTSLYPSEFKGGSVIVCDDLFNVETIHRRDSGDWADGYGNGLIEYNSNIYWLENQSVESPFKLRFRLL
jgi:glutamine cyclotransferase